GQSLRGESDQNAQTGIELIGAGGRKANLEVIVMAINALRAHLSDFRFEIGHAGIFKALAAGLKVDDETREEIRDDIESKNYGALAEKLEQLPDSPTAEAMRQLPRMFGGAEVLEQAYTLFEGCGVSDYLDELGDIYRTLSALGLGDKLIFDFGMVHRKDYYTGILFAAYAHGSGNKILSGGRYDDLLAKFGFPTPACGFAVYLDELTKACTDGKDVVAKIPEILVHSAEGFEIKALEYAAGLAEEKQNYEFSVFDTAEEAMAYARVKGIGRIDLVGESIEIITL
ncbi:MAG: ATP phosphoribosyltransferase regulatory subunit, partial [Clostridia bacterium]|nr:ATP phosphoribosyltransferase regulatory subunit [Clostridia bacterium]